MQTWSWPRETCRAREAHALSDDAHWTRWEFGVSTYLDGRLLRMRRDWADAHADETSRILDQSAKRKGADRLIKYENISLDEVPESHRYSTVLRCAQQPVVLAAQDSTTLNLDIMKYAIAGLS